jgi:hypothetical protein
MTTSAKAKNQISRPTKVVAAKPLKGQKIVEAPLHDAWTKNNAFTLGSDLLGRTLWFAGFIAAAVGLLYWSDSSGMDWAAWVGVLMLAIGCLIPVSLTALFVRVAQANLMLRVYRPLTKRWIATSHNYRKPNWASFGHVAVYLVAAPFLLLNDLYRALKFGLSKLAGKDVRFASSRDLFNLRLIKELNRAVRELGPEKADYLHYVTWYTMNTPIFSKVSPTYQDWKGGIRARVIREMQAQYGPIIKL